MRTSFGLTMNDFETPARFSTVTAAGVADGFDTTIANGARSPSRPHIPSGSCGPGESTQV